jgi:fimbrial chaperone protein
MRANKEPFHGEENYRLVVDELPDANRQRNGAVAVVVRYIVPVFFLAQDASPARLTWSLLRQNGSNMLSAENSGDKEIRIADLSLGRSLIGKGLAGYVLGHSTKVWPLTKAGAGQVKAQTDKGPLSASLGR